MKTVTEDREAELDMTTTPGKGPGEAVSHPIPLEQVFALEILAEGAAKWVPPNDQADLKTRLRQWADHVATGTPRTLAPYWADTASAAFARWLDARDCGDFGIAAPATNSADARDR